MSCTSDRPKRSARHLGNRAAKQCASALAPFACVALFACGSPEEGSNPGPSSTGPDPSAGPIDPGATGGPQDGMQPGGSNLPNVPGGPGSVAGPSPTGSDGLPIPSPTGPSNTPVPGVGGAGPGVDTPVELSQGGTRLRLLTHFEYVTSIEQLLGPVSVELETPPDSSVSGFVAVGAGLKTVTDAGATAYEAASLAAVAEVFNDAERWQALVGCQPAADLSDACVTTYVETFGHRAFRRTLTAEEVQQWVEVAQSGAALAGSAERGLSTATSGMLQSPHFLYRVETNSIDATSGRLVYDGQSMATRLAYALTGGPPSLELLDAAAAGQLDTAEGVRTAAASLLADQESVANQMTEFFSEYAQLNQVTQISKSTSMFPTFTPELQSSMLEGAKLFIKNVVLGDNDVRNFYYGTDTYADANLAPLYGVAAPASGFERITLPAETGRAGILGQAALLAGQSQSDRTSPTRRGMFVLQALLCATPPPTPEGVDTTVIPPDANNTTRQNLEQHRVDPKCATCHALFDPFGLALENFDPIGQYRDNENGLEIDATGEWNGAAFDGGAELGATLGQDPKVVGCLMRNFYRSTNGRAEDAKDADQIALMLSSLESHGYVWNDFLTDFVASDAFRSAPALPVTTETN